MITVPPNAFRIDITVSAQDLDELNHVNNIRYLQWVQDASAAHWNALTTEEQRKQWVWMVQRHEIDYLRQCFEGDELEIYTWPEPPNGRTSIRNVVIKNRKTGKQVMQSRTTWAFVDAKSGRTVPVSEEVAQIFWP